MKPERTRAVLAALVSSLSGFIEQAEALDALHPGSATHLLGSLRQCRYMLVQMIERDSGRE